MFMKEAVRWSSCRRTTCHLNYEGRLQAAARSGCLLPEEEAPGTHPGAGTGTLGGTEEGSVVVLRTEREEETEDKKEEAADAGEYRVELKVRSSLQEWALETERMLGDPPSEAEEVKK